MHMLRGCGEIKVGFCERCGVQEYEMRGKYYTVPWLCISCKARQTIQRLAALCFVSLFALYWVLYSTILDFIHKLEHNLPK